MQDPSTTPTPLPPAEHPADAGAPRLPLLRRLHPILFVIVALVVIFILYQIIAGVITLVVTKGVMSEENAELVRLATLVGQLLFMLAPTLLLLRARYGRIGPFLRIRLPDYREILLTTVGVLALQQVLQGYMALQDAIPLPPELRYYVEMFKRMYDETYRTLAASESVPEFLFVVLTVAMVPAVSEEILFRGLIQGELGRVAGGLRAAVVAGAIFGAYHLNPFGVVPLVVLGIYFGYIVYRSRNLTLAISAHFFNNFVACVALYMHLDDDFVALSPGPSPTPGTIIANVLFFFLVFLIAITAYNRITHGHQEEGPEPHE